MADIDNRVFRDVREVLGAPPGPAGGFPFPFHFHVLDGYKQQASSRGHDPSAIDAAKAERFKETVVNAARAVTDANGNVDVVQAMHGLVRKGTIDPDAEKGYVSYFGLFGQPLASQPTRLEQCLTIRTALEAGENLRISEKIRPFNSGVLVVEDYLGTCEGLEVTYRSALRALDPDEPHRARPGQNGGRICTIGTVPFLVAEHLHLYFAGASAKQPFTEWLKQLSDRPPGIAFLPFLVLGQYRAAGVWMFQGAFDDPENKPLKKYLKETGHTAERWLKGTIGHAVLQSSNILLLKALSQFNDLGNTPLQQCELAQCALARLWYSERLEFSEQKDTKILPNRRGRMGGMEFEMSLTSEQELQTVLGFDKVRFKAPFVPDHEIIEEELLRAERIVDDVGTAAVTASRRAAVNARADIRATLDMTAHDYANALNELMAMTETGSLASPNAADLNSRLTLARSVADGLLGYAWISREMSRAKTMRSGTLTLKFREGPPDAKDVVFWRDFIWHDALYIAFCALRTSIRATRERHKGTFHLDYEFSVDGSRSSPFVATKQISADTMTEALAAPPAEPIDPPWPIPMDTRHEKLADRGERAAMLWGFRELFRNACAKTTTDILQLPGDWHVTLNVRLERVASGSWAFRFSVRNPWLDLHAEPPSVDEISKWIKPIAKALKQATFAQGPVANKSLTYIYQLEVKNEDA